eukprot:324427-Hanusia_phi.AAC.1
MKQLNFSKEMAMNIYKGQTSLPLMKLQYNSTTPHAAVGGYRRAGTRNGKANARAGNRFQQESDSLVCFMKRERELFQAKNASCRRYPWGGFVSQDKELEGSGRSSNRNEDLPHVRPMCDFPEWENAQKEKLKMLTSSQKSREK